MNAFILQESLARRYNTHFTDLRNKITSLSKTGSVCSYYNHLSSRPVGHTMHQSLKLKIQHGINAASFADADTPALFVGGRRRNRKKRKNKNGQNKRKAKKGTERDVLKPPSITPDFEYFPDYVPQKPVVTCVDIEEPVFVYEPVSNKQILITGHDTDSLYNSNESLDSKERRDSGCEQEIRTYDGADDYSSNEDSDLSGIPTKAGFPRTRSQDSGVYDDSFEVESVDEDTFDQTLETNVEHDPANISLKEELEEAEKLVITESSPNENFEDVDLNETEDDADDKTKADENSEIKIVTDLDHIADGKHFLNLIEDEDDIIFDISQLELNTEHEDISKLTKETFQLTEKQGSILDPTVLEDEDVPHRFPMDLLIDDDKDEQVLFDAHARKELCITCNPLYEQSLKDEEERVSIKGYQSGFQTNFDSVHHIRIPGVASNEASKESSRLLRSRKDDDELACCVIL